MSQDARRRGLLIFAFLLGWLVPGPVPAQARSALKLAQADTETFPEVALYVSAADESLGRIPGLTPEDFTVIEDGIAIGSPRVAEALVGTRQIYAVNTLPEMDTRDPAGLSRFDHIRKALLDIWSTPEASLFGVDDVELLTNDGVVVERSPSTAALASLIDRLSPSFGSPRSEYDLLLSAIDRAAASRVAPGMTAHVVFITTLPALGETFPLPQTISRAQANAISVHTILIAPEESAASPRCAALRSLAEETGGLFSLFNVEEGLSRLARIIHSHRTVYRLTYHSQIRTAGAHNAQVRLVVGDIDLVSDLRTFALDLRPPEVVFIQPPRTILRKSDSPWQTLDTIPPTSQALRLLITFPDGHARELSSSQLWADGVLVTERQEAPFDSLDWDLADYSSTGAHRLRAVVEDSLGLASSTEVIVIDVQVSAPPAGLAALQPALGPLLGAFTLLLVGIMGAVILTSMRHRIGRQPRSPAVPSPPRINPRLRASLTPAPAPEAAEAALIPVAADGRELAGIPLTGVDLTLGRDASLASVVFDDASVDNLHAKLVRQADGGYRVQDQGSVAGTWVNHDPVPDTGQRLHHNDLVHLGRIALRFRYAAPPAPRPIRIVPTDSSGRPLAPDPGDTETPA